MGMYLIACEATVRGTMLVDAPSKKAALRFYAMSDVTEVKRADEEFWKLNEIEEVDDSDWRLTWNGKMPPADYTVNEDGEEI